MDNESAATNLESVTMGDSVDMHRRYFLEAVGLDKGAVYVTEWAD